MADFSGQFVGHTARQRLAGVHQLSSLDPSCRPQTVTLPRTDKTLQLRCHSRFLPPREPASVYIRYGSRRCVVTSRARTHTPCLVTFFNFFFFVEDSFHVISGHISRIKNLLLINSNKKGSNLKHMGQFFECTHRFQIIIMYNNTENNGK